MEPDIPEHELSLFEKARRALIGAPRNVSEPSIFHKLSLIPILAWIGLGADGLSSSSYGPEEAFRTLGQHTYLAIFLALATALTVLIISYAYSRIIEHFPHGRRRIHCGNPHYKQRRRGYIGMRASLVDYMLTITVSLVSCGDAIFSFLPLTFQKYKLTFVGILIVLLVIINLRGVKESVKMLAPIFIIFVITHILLIGYGIGSHTADIRPLANQVNTDFTQGLSSIGIVAMLAIFLRAFSLGAGTYTGIEAVSNGMQIMRDPKVQTGKRTMVYMASSLAITAGGLLVCYLLFHIKPVEGRTLNAILAENMFGNWPMGQVIALITILSEGALLVVAAQTGFIDGPRVMSNRHRPLAPPAVCRPFREADHAGRGAAHGCCRIRSPSLHPRINQRPGNHVLNQRVRNLFPFPVRNGEILYQEQEPRQRLEETYCHSRGGSRGLRDHPRGHVVREI